jgi:hypothetical protein
MRDRSNRLRDANSGARPDAGKRLALIEATVDILTLFLFIATAALLVDLFSQWIG